jgi:hypothetical protein
MKYFYEYNGKLIECKNLEMYGYFQGGYQSENDKGILSTLSMSQNGATILTPVLNESGQTICRPEYAGKEVKELNINLNNL